MNNTAPRVHTAWQVADLARATAQDVSVRPAVCTVEVTQSHSGTSSTAERRGAFLPASGVRTRSAVSEQKLSPSN